MKHEHNVCTWTETSPSIEPAPFAVFTQYPASPSALPSLGSSTGARSCQHSSSRSTAAKAARPPWPAGHGPTLHRAVSPSSGCHLTHPVVLVRLLPRVSTPRQAPTCPAYSNTLDISSSADPRVFWEETKVTLHNQGFHLHTAFQKPDSLLPCTLSSHVCAHKAKGNCCTLTLVPPCKI